MIDYLKRFPMPPVKSFARALAVSVVVASLTTACGNATQDATIEEATGVPIHTADRGTPALADTAPKMSETVESEENGLAVPTPTPQVLGGGFMDPLSIERPDTLESNIFHSSIIARVEPVLSITPIGREIDNGEGVASTYQPFVEIRFKVIEYLKGSGPDEIVVDNPIRRHTYLEQEKAEEIALVAKEERNTSWDHLEAIVFLFHPSESEDASWLYGTGGNYLFMHMDAWGGSPHGLPHTFDSHVKAWLPATAERPPGTAPDGAQKFWVDPKPIKGVSEAVPMTVAEMKEEIRKMDALIAAGEGIDGYEDCLMQTFGYEADLLKDHELHGEPYTPGNLDHEVQSGMPSGSIIDEFGVGGEGYIELIPLGRFALLFEFVIADHKNNVREIDFEATRTDITGYRVLFRNTRPLPEGIYEMETTFQQSNWRPCNFISPSSTATVIVVAPSGSVHESFFDPVDVGMQTVGAGNGNGLLDPNVFDAPNDAETTVHRIGWSSGNVEMQLTPHTLLPDHHIDFIALDGLLSLRLDFDDAVTGTETDGTQALSWGVCEQPWEDGDQLMIRISESGADLTGATNDAECAASTSAPTPTTIPTDTPAPTVTPTATETPVPQPTPTAEPTAIPEAEAPVATAPQNLSALATHDSVTLTWDAQNSPSIVGYQILRKVQGSETTVSVDDVDSDESSYIDSEGIQPETEYEYTVRTRTDDGDLNSAVTVTTQAAP